MNGIEHQEHSRRALVDQTVTINKMGRRYLREDEMALQRAADEKSFTERYGEVANVTMGTIVEYVAYGIGLVAVYCLDVLLFGGPAEYMVSVLGSGSTFWSTFAKYTVPLVFLVVEILLAIKITRASDEARFEFGSRAARIIWIALGVLLALVMPLAACATAQSVSVVDGSDTSTFMVIVLAIISFVAHILVLFGGRLALQAKTYLLYAFGARRCRRRAAWAKRRAARTLATLNAAFIRYVHVWRAHNMRHGAMPSGPFDEDVLGLLQRQFSSVTLGSSREAFPVVLESEEPS